MPHRLDTDQQVFCYVDEFYCLSNFSPFRLWWEGMDFDTSEHAYQWEKFRRERSVTGGDAVRIRLQQAIHAARSAHDAFRLAQTNQRLVPRDWADRKLNVMRALLRAKVDAHPYVRRKLLETGTREIIEDSWRDSYWGWGPHKDGQNWLGKLWMEIRTDLRETP